MRPRPPELQNKAPSQIKNRIKRQSGWRDSEKKRLLWREEEKRMEDGGGKVWEALTASAASMFKHGGRRSLQGREAS